MPILWFRSLKIWDQKIIKLPVIGDVTVRQAILLGFGIFIDYAIFAKSGSLGVTLSLLLALPTFLLYLFAFWPVKSYPIEYVIFRMIFRPRIHIPRPEEVGDWEEVGEISIDVLNIDKARPVFIKRNIGRGHAGKGYEVRVGGAVISSGVVPSNGQVGFWFIPSKLGEVYAEIYVDGSAEPVDRLSIKVKPKEIGEVI